MKISYNWLKELVAVPSEGPQAARDLGQRLTSVGLAVDTVETLADDTIFDFDITTNRPDCLSHLGMAREVRAIDGSPLKRPESSVQEGSKSVDSVFSVDLVDADLCGRYCGRYIEGVRVGPSPEWLKLRLEGLGIRSINNVVDVTNYVLMEMGQPLHAFDADRLRGRRVVIRRADLDEPMTTLDGVERRLNPSILVIADAERPVALAGVMGGADSEISLKSTNVFLESAWFDPMTIRKAARALGMNTEASYRFERGADIGVVRAACDRAAEMIRQLAGGEVYSGAIDVYPSPSPPREITLRRGRIAAFLGAPVEDTIVERIFERLEFAVVHREDGWRVSPPTFRVDVHGEEDLLEEIARHYGYDRFPATLPPSTGAGAALPLESEERLLRNTMSGCGYSEIMTYAFSSDDAEAPYAPEAKPVRLLNPMSEDASILRVSLVGAMLRTLQWNLNRGVRDLRFYELAKTYGVDGERRALVMGATGRRDPAGVHPASGDFSFFDLKGDLETLFERLDFEGDLAIGALPPYYHPGRAARFGRAVVFGELHPDYAERLKIRQRVYLAELDIETLLHARSRRQIAPVPRHPSVRRDFSLLLDRGTRYGDVQRVIADARIPELERVEPFDRMESGPFPETKYALSISVTYRAADRTLTDPEVEQFDRRIVEMLAERLQAQLRS
ncbi:MAG TPA: phenylalanine--tRNA ligase subunit beta [Terriglobia bacterium]|nr:phenylalanine--tRNA ligase subunit beta [Terriglobia bacterium]